MHPALVRWVVWFDWGVRGIVWVKMGEWFGVVEWVVAEGVWGFGVVHLG